MRTAEAAVPHPLTRGDLHVHLAGPGAVEFSEEDALPGSQEEPAAADDDRHLRADNGGFNMGRGVALQVAVGFLIADELVQELILMYNKARQASITKELIEIVSGAEALK